MLFVAGAFDLTNRPRPKGRAGRFQRDGALGYWETLEMAREWDEMGYASPLEFVDALECEVEGTRQQAVVAEVLNFLAHDGLEE